MGFLSKVKSIDLFGPRVSLRLSNKKEFKTALGGGFTVILFFATIFVAVVYFIEMTRRDNPTLQFKETLWETSEKYALSRYLVTHAFAVYDINANAYTNAVNVEMVVVDADGLATTAFVMGACAGMDDSAQRLREQIEVTWDVGGDASVFFCLSDADYQVVEKLLMNSEASVEVKVAGLAWSASDEYEVRYIQMDHFYDATNYKEPFQEYWRSQAIQVTGEFLVTSVRVQMELKTIVTDIGYFGSATDESSQIAVKNIYISESNPLVPAVVPTHSIIFKFTFNRKIEVNTRNYIQILDVLAVIGGFIKSQMVCYRFLTRPFTKTALYTSLLNELFCFEEGNLDGDDEKEASKLGSSKHQAGRLHLAATKEEQDREKEENQKLTHLLNQVIYEDNHGGAHPESDSQRVEAENLFMRFMRIGETTLRMTHIDYVRNIFTNCIWCRHRKAKLIKISKKRVNQRLDIVYILKKLVEIDKLKMILLSDEQRRVFDYLPKPLVSISSTSRKQQSHHSRRSTLSSRQSMRSEWSLLNSEDSTLHKAILAVHSFQTILKTESDPLSLIDLKLIEMLDPRIIQKFSAIRLDAKMMITESEKESAAADEFQSQNKQHEESFEIQIITSNVPQQNHDVGPAAIDQHETYIDSPQPTQQQLQKLKQNMKPKNSHYSDSNVAAEHAKQLTVENPTTINPVTTTANEALVDKSESVPFSRKITNLGFNNSNINGISYLMHQRKKNRKATVGFDQLRMEQSQYSVRGNGGGISMIKSSVNNNAEIRGFNVNKMHLISQYLLYKDTSQVVAPDAAYYPDVTKQLQVETSQFDAAGLQSGGGSGNRAVSSVSGGFQHDRLGQQQQIDQYNTRRNLLAVQTDRGDQQQQQEQLQEQHHYHPHHNQFQQQQQQVELSIREMSQSIEQSSSSSSNYSMNNRGGCVIASERSVVHTIRPTKQTQNATTTATNHTTHSGK